MTFTVAISNGLLLVLLLYLQNTHAQQGPNNNVVNNAGVSPTCNTAGVNNAPQNQHINWQYPSSIQVPISQQNFQPGARNSQMKQNQNPMLDILSALDGLRFNSQKPVVQNYDQPCQVVSNPQFKYQFVPQNKPTENQAAQYSVPVQILANSQGPAYNFQPTSSSTAQGSQGVTSQSQPLVFTMSPQPTTGQGQPLIFTLQPTQSLSDTQQQAPQVAKRPNSSENPMAMLMSQLQSPPGSSDMSSLLPLLMNSKQDKSGSGGMKALLPLIFNLLSDRGCGCPHCGCPCKNAEPTINSGYSNLMNYNQPNFAGKPAEKPRGKAKIIEESSEQEVELIPEKMKKSNEVNDISEEEEDEEEEYDDSDE